MTRNQLELRSIKETERHNRATEVLESEKNRYTEEHYIRADAAAMSQAGAAWANVEVNRMNAITNRLSVEETMRYHDLQIGLERDKLQLSTWTATTQAKQRQQEIYISKFQAELAANKFEWQKEYEGEQLHLSQYQANLRGLEFTENIRQFNVNNEYQYYRTDKEYKARQTGNVLNYIGTVINAVGRLATGIVH